MKHKKKEHKKEEKPHRYIKEIKHEAIKHKKSRRLEPWHYPWIVIGILLIISAIILLPTKVVSYQVEVPYIDTEQYTVEVPYEDVEEYTVQVPYETEETYIETIPYEEEEAYQKCFIVCWTAYRTVTKYKDVVKTRTVTEYRDETRYRKVTKTRTETKEKEVRKTRMETRQKEVNWLFGFDAIIKFRD